ncbi:MAG: cyclic nucleotide-binding domain-containing protein [Alphaproteobacteria bacterium]|nr:cyclic nucleotide-binding domain-containing protein [Alphaproteobacteria bacterium]
MSIHEEVELLKGVPLFSKLEGTKLKLLAFTSERITFAPGQDVCRQGDMGDAMYVVLTGSADIIIETPSGPHKVADLRKNGFFGEIAILLDVPRTATVTVREKLTALKITKEQFFRMVSEFPTMAVEIMRELAHRLDDTNRQLSAARAKAA